MRSKKIVVFESEVRDYMKANGIKRATLHRRRKIAEHLRKVKYVQSLEV